MSDLSELTPPTLTKTLPIAKPQKVAILGAGSWGTALASLLAGNGHEVILWDRNAEIVEHINTYHNNTVYLPNTPLPTQITATGALKSAVTSSTDWIILAVSSSGIRPIAADLCHLIAPTTTIISAAKGLEAETGLTMSEIIDLVMIDATYNGLAALSGPNLASEVIRKIPSAAVICSNSLPVARRAQNLLMSPLVFRVYANTDIKGVELAGALKNVLAIGAGISDGLGFGDNTKAALMTRGLMEMTQLGIAAGATPITFLGLAGVGDLIATSTSKLSRNYRVGVGLASNKSITEVLKEIGQVAEGIGTSQAAHLLSKRYKIQTPLFETIYDILYGGKSPGSAVEELMSRPARDEFNS